MSDTPQLLALMQKTREMRAYDCVKEFESLARKLEKENIELKEQLDAAHKHSALAVSFLAQAQVELVETRHHLNKPKETRLRVWDFL